VGAVDNLSGTDPNAIAVLTEQTLRSIRTSAAEAAAVLAPPTAK
jgi:hypothetical protein